MNNYIVAFDDSELDPWLHSFVCNSLKDVEDKIIDYIINMYDFDSEVPSEFHKFKNFCKKNEIYIGQIKQVDYD